MKSKNASNQNPESVAEALLKSELRFRSLIAATTKIVWITNARGEVEEDIPGWRAFTGQSIDEAKGWGWISALHPDDRERSATIWSKAVEEHSLYKIVYRARRYDGEYRFLDTLGVPVFEKDGSIGEWVGSCTDITESKDNKALLLKQQEELQVIIDSVPAWIFYKDKENLFIRVNKAFSDVMKMSKKQLEGKSCFDFYPKEQAEAFWKDDLEVITSDKPKRNIIESMTTEDGTFWVQTDKIPYHDLQGNCVGIIGFTLDITERKNAEEALVTSEALLQETSRIAKVGGWEINLETQELIWSEEVYRIHEVDMNIKPSLAEAIDFYAPEYRPVISEAVAKAIDNGKPFDLELQLITALGNWPWVHAKGQALKMDGKAIKVYGTFQDITERKLVEEELNKYRYHLEEQVKERTAELMRSNKELEQFAYIASHDLQEPLRMVSSYTQLLEKRYSDKLDQDAKEFIQYAVDGANRMQFLINDLLEYSRITTQGREFIEIDAFSILGQAIRNLQMKIENCSAIVTNGELPIIKADEIHMVRLFQNLIDNAIKFKGTESPRIQISCKPDKDNWLFSVKDNGIGIDQKYKERIFQIFQRLSNRNEYPGTGIGLAICKRIVERHGGNIWIESEPGKGTTFLFTIKK